MSGPLSYHRLLGIDEAATSEDIKQAYRKQALRFHPDLNNGNESAAAMFLLVKNAYESLSENARRSEVDSFVQTSSAIKAQRDVAPRPKAWAHPTPRDSKLNPYENDLNYIMWDLEDMVGKPRFPSGFVHPVLDFITYLDKWVLMPTGFTATPARDAREGARDPTSYIAFFLGRKSGVKCHYRDFEDYFSCVRHRVMGFQSWTDPSLISEIKGVALMKRLNAMRDQILYHLMRSQRIGFYYLFEFEKVRKGLKSEVAMYVHEACK